MANKRSRTQSPESEEAAEDEGPHSVANRVSFKSYDEYDVHYQKTHIHRCSECHKNFPSSHFLDIHIAENHDPLAAAKKARGDKTFACFVEDCDRICSTPQKRRMHLIDKHHFPKNYNFFIVNDGLDKRKSMLRPGFSRNRRTSSISSGQQGSSEAAASNSQVSTETLSTDHERTATNDATNLGSDESEEEQSPASPRTSKRSSAMPIARKNASEDVDEITKSMSALKFVPPSVRFGRGHGRGFAKR